ncbi:MAG: hypothetical protein ACRETP_01040 [Steroidobacteraceae bacterium]
MIAVLAIAFLAVFGWVVMQLWNWLVPALFHGPTLRYWQAVGLLVLSRILFGGMRGHGGHGHWRRRMRERWHERWEAMTPEERARLRERLFEHRCGRRAGAAQEGTQPQP